MKNFFLCILTLSLLFSCEPENDSLENPKAIESNNKELNTYSQDNYYSRETSELETVITNIITSESYIAAEDIYSQLKEKLNTNSIPDKIEDIDELNTWAVNNIELTDFQTLEEINTFFDNVKIHSKNVLTANKENFRIASSYSDEEILIASTIATENKYSLSSGGGCPCDKSFNEDFSFLLSTLIISSATGNYLYAGLVQYDMWLTYDDYIGCVINNC
ncbi:MAG: hypothetical protein ABGW76_10960 [Mesonia sp.]|uniref:hypothetical protein n=1 Tax=Mesonia sp. TaxID=1960830 RepID=UPI003241DB7F